MNTRPTCYLLMRSLTIVCFGMAILSASISPITSMPSVHYITESGAGSMDGSDWDNAASGEMLQTMIDGAQPGDSVWVSCGVYYATTGTDRSIAFHMRNNVTIVGSFQGDEETFSQRELQCGPCSELSGNIGGPDVFDNTYTVIVNIGLDTTATLDGFRVVDGFDNRSVNNIEAGLGGGVYNGGSGAGGEGGSCNPTFRNCVFESNYATYGAGMFNNGHANGNSAPALFNCVFVDNYATVGGGGMDSYGWNGGSVAPNLTQCIFYNNRSGDRAGAMYCWGGRNGNCSPTIVSSLFINNTATNIAGGIIVDNSEDLAGNPPYTGTAEIYCTNSIFLGNAAGAGPQFYILGNGGFNATFSAVDTVGQTAAHPISGSATGNIYSDPGFVDTTNAIGLDACWMTEDDGLALLIHSLCINAGDTSITEAEDLTGQQRISGTQVDIGAYEYALSDSVSWTGNINTNWFDSGNWSPQRVPDLLQTVIIPGVGDAANQPVVTGDTAVCSGLVLLPAADVTVESKINLRQN